MLVAADDLHALVNDPLDMGLIHTERFSLSPQAFDLSGAIQEAVEGLSPQALAKRLTLVNEVPPELPSLPADGKRIAQVLRNLLSNAIKYSPSEGVVRIRCDLEAAVLRCEIEDMGPGIPPEDQAWVFQPFVRLGGAEVPGTGLGLNIAKALVEAHRGCIGVRPSPGGVGSVFWFTLPRR